MNLTLLTWAVRGVLCDDLSHVAWLQWVGSGGVCRWSVGWSRRGLVLWSLWRLVAWGSWRSVAGGGNGSAGEEDGDELHLDGWDGCWLVIISNCW